MRFFCVSVPDSSDTAEQGENIPEITNTMEGGERKLGLFSFTVLKEAARSRGWEKIRTQIYKVL